MYTSHRIPDSPGSPAPERPPAARRASESGGGSENRLEVACSRGTRCLERERDLSNLIRGGRIAALPESCACAAVWAVN